jgi:hypothetical protein
MTLLIAGALASPTVYEAIVGKVEVGDAAIRYLICVPVAAIMLAVLRGLTRGYRPVQPRRRATDRAAADGPADTDDS